MPETVVTFVAVVFGHDAAEKEIGIGAAIGGPLVLSTIAYAVVGGVFFFNRKLSNRIFLPGSSSQSLVGDQEWFISIFAFKIGLGLIAFAIKPWLGVLFLLAYAAYVRRFGFGYK